MGQKNFPFFICVFSIFCVLILPFVVQDGMFMDGLIYATVAKNFAHGMGTWWNLYLNDSIMTSYHDQPPLSIWMESFFFKILGDSIYTERLYSFLTACISGGMVMLIWNSVYETNSDYRKISWMPVLFWIIPPACFWTYSNNMVENTMSIFILLAVWLILKGLKSTQVLPFLVAGAICIFLSSMCKGIQGMFPLAVAGIYWLVYRNFSLGKMFFYSLILIVVPVAIYVLLFLNPVILQSFKDYFEARLHRTFNFESAATTNHRWYIAYRLMMELLGPLMICIILFFVYRKNKFDWRIIKSNQKIILLFFLIGLSGSLPLMITMEQRRFYLVPSLPYFAIALASLVVPGVSMLMQKINTQHKIFKAFRAFSFLSLTTVLIFSGMQLGKTKRDKEMLEDVYAVGKMIPSRTTISMDESLYDNWSLQLYFARHYNITLVPKNKSLHRFLLVSLNATAPDEKKYSEINLGLKKYKLYQLQN